jgi:IS30 family transposase
MKRKVPKPPGQKPYRELPFEKMPAWYHELVYRSAAFNLSLRQLALILGKNHNTIMKVLRLKEVQKAIAAEKARQRKPMERQLEAIDALAISQVHDLLLRKTTQPSVLASIAAKHLVGRGFYVTTHHVAERIEHTGEVKVVIAPELEDKPPEEKKP